MAKKFLFRGHDAESIQKLSVDDYMRLLPSNLRRTLRRNGVQIKKFVEKLRRAKKRGKTAMKTQFREMVVLPEMLGMTVQVYNGKQYLDVPITLERMGHRLGEFSNPMKLVKHSGPGIGATRGSKAIELK